MPVRLRIAYDTAADVARAVSDLWVRKGREAFPLPYNRFQWDTGHTCFVVPARDKTAFRFSKIIATTTPRWVTADEMFVGIYVERGVGSSLGGYYPDEWVTGPTWRWHAVVRDLSTGGFQASLADVARRMDRPVEIHLDAHVAVVGGGGIRPPHDLLAFESLDGNLITLTRPAVLATQPPTLNDAANATTVQQLGLALGQLSAAGSTWVNLYIGQTFQRSGPLDTSALNAPQVTEWLLEPLHNWVK